MTDDLENLLQRFRPVGPPASLRNKVLRQDDAVDRYQAWRRANP